MRTFPAPRRALVVLLACTLLLASTPLAASAGPDEVTPVAPRSVVELRSGPGGRVWRGSMRVAFTHEGVDVLDRIYLRLWSNGVLGCRRQAIVLSGLVGGTIGELTKRCTLLPVDLDDPLDPGERGSLSFSLRIRVPRLNDRFGSTRGLSLLGSALPILAVRDDRGWHLPPFVDLGESFYSVSGRYRVRLDVPRTLVTATTGWRVGRRIRGDRVVETFVARRVRDFEWAAGRLSTVSGRAGETRVSVWYRAATIGDARARSMLRHAVRSMEVFEDAFGPYPYPEVDVVLTGFTSFGGMEYPTLVFSNAHRPTIAHELAHQWFYSIVGNDQFAEPWLDEGFAQWSQSLPTRPWRSCAGIRWPSGTARMTNDMAYWRAHPSEYGPVAYWGGGCLLAQLASELGLARFLRLLGRYVEAHRHGLATTEDFARIVDRVAARHAPGFDTDAFWAGWRVDRA